MFTHMDFYRITFALNSVIYENKAMFSRSQERLKDATALADSAGIERAMRSLIRCEKNIEENIALLFKTEAIRRWEEAEKILFPERFVSNTKEGS
ncbi:hypothetical protein HZF08_33495 [Paenibacillus sp. CGMCC 1.16610]|uniref:Uncharacterized protein n=1 Tax=Paenibacillus anseongense TaxID=2682845 RepID=A0ABW9U0P9_9BACL|nr:MULTISPECIES: hypothetical protein [Paenibacillus]MBA2943187.1 hypothetical protein [Paenibacillus sp. CGMCC 1.16610]MVQ33684.1 hypothetical protein [Paenibacillus anseongense]